jgi:hypothetical protein
MILSRLTVQVANNSIVWSVQKFEGFYILFCSKQAEKEEQAIKEVVAPPLKADGGEFAPQPAEVWANEISEPVTRSWGEEVPVVAPVVGATTPAVPYNASEDWASQVST